MMKEKISVLVPVFNAAEYIEDCMRSIQNQLYQNIEVIIVNDGSTDKSGEICDEFARKQNNVFVYHVEHQGVANARNVAVEKATGDYITFIDADDLVSRHILQVLYDVMKKRDSDIVQCSHFESQFRNIDEEALELQCIYPMKAKEYTREEALWAMQMGGNPVRCMVWGKLYKRKVFDGVFFVKGKSSDDEFVIHKLLYNGTKFTLIYQPMYLYYMSENSVMRRPFDSSFFSAIEMLRERAIFFEEKGLYEHANITWQRHAHIIMKLYQRTAKHCPDQKEMYAELMNAYRDAHKRLLTLPHINDEILKIHIDFLSDPLHVPIYTFSEYIAGLKKYSYSEVVVQ